MPRCCGGSTCACVIQEGGHINVDGTGQTQDPFVISTDIALKVTDTKVIDMTLNGIGTAAAPWDISASFAPTAQLHDLPDVNVPNPTNGQVLAWNNSVKEWQAAAPTTAAAGAVQHDTSLLRGGSVGNPPPVNEDPARMLGTTAAGLGLSDTGMNSVVRRFANAAARSAATPAPVLNALTMLDSTPGQIDFWNGSSWVPGGGTISGIDALGQELMQLSGPYTGVQRIALLIRNTSTTTDTNGEFDVLAAADLAGRAGVLSAFVQPTPGSALPLDNTLTPWQATIGGRAGALRGVAWRLSDGTPLNLSPIGFTVMALLY